MNGHEEVNSFQGAWLGQMVSTVIFWGFYGALDHTDFAAFVLVAINSYVTKCNTELREDLFG
jgi:hypothetical protein